MLTKTLKFDGDVLDVLKTMQWENDGLLGKLVGQLDRDLYVRVNKSLVAMGGKWNRKMGGHVFTFDPRSQVDGLINDGTLVVEKDGFFETPLSIVRMMIELANVKVGDLVLEPSAGMGAIAYELRHVGAVVFCVEMNKDRAGVLIDAEFNVECKDFLLFRGTRRFDAVVMNPPFEMLQDVDHVRHAYKFLKVGGRLVSIMTEGVFFRSDKKSVLFREWLESVGGFSEKLPVDSFKESGTGVNTRIVVIIKGDKS